VARSRRTKNDAVVSKTEGPPKSLSQPATVTDGDIARRAYDLYLARGCGHGHDVDDWLRAERELGRPMSASVA